MPRRMGVGGMGGNVRDGGSVALNAGNKKAVGCSKTTTALINDATTSNDR